MSELRYWLLVYDPVAQELDLEREFTDARAAEAAYSELETRHREKGDICQVVLFGSRSRAALEQTHPHYFSAPKRVKTGDTLDFLPV